MGLKCQVAKGRLVLHYSCYNENMKGDKYVGTSNFFLLVLIQDRARYIMFMIHVGIKYIRAA